MGLLMENPNLQRVLIDRGLVLDMAVLTGHLEGSNEFIQIGDIKDGRTVVGFIAERQSTEKHEAGMVTNLRAVLFAEDRECDEDAVTFLQCHPPYIVVERDGVEVMEYTFAANEEKQSQRANLAAVFDWLDSDSEV